MGNLLSSQTQTTHEVTKKMVELEEKINKITEENIQLKEDLSKMGKSDRSIKSLDAREFINNIMENRKDICYLPENVEKAIYENVVLLIKKSNNDLVIENDLDA